MIRVTPGLEFLWLLACVGSACVEILLIPGDKRCAPVGLVSPVELCGLMHYGCIYARMFFVSACTVFLSCYKNTDEFILASLP